MKKIQNNNNYSNKKLTPTKKAPEYLNIKRELFIVIDEMTNIFVKNNFRKKLEQQKEDSSNRISHLEACLTQTFGEFEQYIHRGILPYTNNEEIEMLKTRLKRYKRKITN